MSRVKFEATPLDRRVLAVLERVANNPTIEDVPRRAKSILCLWSGKNITEVVEELGYNRKSVSKFRRRFQQIADRLNELAQQESVEDCELEDVIINSLSDKPRTGRTLLYSPEQRQGIVRISKETPRTFGYDDNGRMTLPRIKEQAIKEGIVKDISIPTVWRIVNGACSG